jgi:hypothetical protein
MGVKRTPSLPLRVEKGGKRGKEEKNDEQKIKEKN